MYIHSDWMRALFTGETHLFLKEHEGIDRQDLGMLELPTGRIVANDPCCCFETAPFTRAVAPGNYPVCLFVLESGEDQRVAYAAVCFRDEIPQRFELALTEGQDPAALGEDEFYGYGVDSGTGGFMDDSVCQAYDQMLRTSQDSGYPLLDEALSDSYVDTYSVANVALPQGGNLVAFSSGWGDGCYPSYWGFNGDGAVCCLVTDFCIVGD